MFCQSNNVVAHPVYNHLLYDVINKLMLLYPLIGIIAWSQNVLYKKLQIIKFHKNFKIIPSAERNTGVPFFFSVIWRSSPLLCNFIEIALLHGCSPVNLLHIFRTPFPKNISGGLLRLFGCLTANFGPLSKEQLLSPNENHCGFDIFRPECHQEPGEEVGSILGK